MKRCLRSKRADISPIVVLVLAILASIAILGIIQIVIGILNNPDKATSDGFICRASLVASFRSEEVFQGGMKLKNLCTVIEKKIPLKEIYKGKKVSSMSADEFRNVTKRDMAELIAKAWWIGVEGDRPDYAWDRLKDVISSENGCMVLYAVRIHPPKAYSSFNSIPEDELRNYLNDVNKSDAFAKAFDKEQTIMDYISTTGKTAGVFVTAKDENGKFKRSGISVIGGTDQIYGIAVGFKSMSKVGSALKEVFGGETTSLNEDSSFILVAPFNEISSLCDVNNE